MRPDQTTPTLVTYRQFSYRPGGRFWWRYLPVAAGIVFVYWILSWYEIQPFFAPGFWILIALVVLDVGVSATLRRSAPHTFQVNEEALIIGWSDHDVIEPLKSVSIRRALSRLLSSGTFLKAGGITFTVFHDLEGYRDLLAIIEQRGGR